MKKLIITILLFFNSTLFLIGNEDKEMNSHIYSGISSGTNGKLLIFVGYFDNISNLSLETSLGFLPYGVPMLEFGNMGANLSMSYQFLNIQKYKLNTQILIGIVSEKSGYNGLNYRNHFEKTFFGLALNHEINNFFLITGISSNKEGYSENHNRKIGYIVQIGYKFKFFN